MQPEYYKTRWYAFQINQRGNALYTGHLYNECPRIKNHTFLIFTFFRVCAALS